VSENLTDEEIEQIRARIIELQLEHQDLNQVIDRLTRDATVEQLQVKRLKKRKLHLKDQLALLENRLIPDILA
jgi:hypothetical protein